MAVSIIVILLLPKILGVEDYGYFQLFIFYVSYVGFLHLGWNDGIYLRYGGHYYKNLNYKLFNEQFIMLIVSQTIIAFCLIVITGIFIGNENRSFIIYTVSLVLVIINTRHMLIFILQATNRVKEYAIVTLLEKVIFIIFVIGFILLDMVDFRFFIISDVIGKLISFFIATFFCKEIVFKSLKDFHFNFAEAIHNINVGIKLMLANIAGMLIIGIVRFGIERSWDIATFGKVSLTLSISKFMMIFISAIGILIFPILKRINENKLSEVYNLIRHLLGPSLLLILILYYPIKTVLLYWLPNYSESLFFMALLFPMVIFEGKTILLLNTYLKALRKEKLMLTINIISLAFSIFLTIISTVMFKNLELAVLSILIALAFKSIVTEFLVASYLETSVIKDIILEVIMTIMFITFSWFVSTWIGLGIYALSYIGYLIIKRKEIINSLIQIRKIIRD